MARKFKELRAKMSPKARERSMAIFGELQKEMPLAELRRARGLSQEALAKVLGVRQSSVSKLERRTDMYISSLRSHIKAMGGELEIIARFPDGELKISDFSSIEPKASS
jgi:ribosome-binding protein aMBF1 (putative translation factor)